MTAGLPEAGLGRRRGYSGYLSLLLLFGVALAQATIMPEASLGSSMPLLPVLVVVSWGILRGPIAGGWWALVLGLLLDWRSPEPLGSYGIPMLGVAAVAGLGSQRIFAHNLLLPGALAALGTVVFLGLQLLIVSASGGLVLWSREGLAAVILPTVILNFLWLPVVYFPLRALAAGLGAPRIGWER